MTKTCPTATTFASPIARARCGECPFYTLPACDLSDTCPGCGSPIVASKVELIDSWWIDDSNDCEDGPLGPFPTLDQANAVLKIRSAAEVSR